MGETLQLNTPRSLDWTSPARLEGFSRPGLQMSLVFWEWGYAVKEEHGVLGWDNPVGKSKRPEASIPP